MIDVVIPRSCYTSPDLTLPTSNLTDKANPWSQWLRVATKPDKRHQSMVDFLLSWEFMFAWQFNPEPDHKTDRLHFMGLTRPPEIDDSSNLRLSQSED